ncbi:MAG: helix-turn-helix domain-containing protein [Candidatus Limnocylindrales bacterium]
MIRNTVVKPPRRPYSRALREQQAETTRTRILEALERTMAKGVAGLSIAAVAREAAVSIPTIYRQFGSKQGLIDALSPYVIAKAGLMPDPPPATLPEVARTVRSVFRNLAGMDAMLRAAMASELGRQVRLATMPKRFASHRETVGRLAPNLGNEDLDRLAKLSLILTSTSSFRAFKDYLGLGPDASAELVTWALGAMIDGARHQTSKKEEVPT